MEKLQFKSVIWLLPLLLLSLLWLKVFGEVAEGLETLARINETYVDEKNRPYKNIRFDISYSLQLVLLFEYKLYNI